MANPLFGEASLVLEGRTLTLRLDFEAMCAIEEIAGASWDVVMGSITDQGKPKLRSAASVVAGMLSHHHPELANVADAGALYMEGGEKTLKAMTEAMDRAFGGRAARPPKGAARAKAPPRGTGTRSTKRGRARA